MTLSDSSFWVIYRGVSAMAFCVQLWLALRAAKQKEYSKATYEMAWAILFWLFTTFGGVN